MDSDVCVKEEALMSDSDNNAKGVESVTPPPSLSEQFADAELLNNHSKVADFKDGPSESDSSTTLNEGIINNNNHSPNASNSSCGGGFLQNQQQMCPKSPTLRFNCSSSSMNYLSFTDSGSNGLESGNENVYHPQYVKLEEHNFFSGEETCNLFSDEATPTLHWYCPDQWT